MRRTTSRRWVVVGATLALTVGAVATGTIPAVAAAKPPHGPRKSDQAVPNGSASQAAAARALRDTPASFVANAGQAPAGVAFVGNGAAVSLGPNDFVVTVSQAAATVRTRQGGGRPSAPRSMAEAPVSGAALRPAPAVPNAPGSERRPLPRWLWPCTL